MRPANAEPPPQRPPSGWTVVGAALGWAGAFGAGLVTVAWWLLAWMAPRDHAFEIRFRDMAMCALMAELARRLGRRADAALPRPHALRWASGVGLAVAGLWLFGSAVVCAVVSTGVRREEVWQPASAGLGLLAGAVAVWVAATRVLAPAVRPAPRARSAEPAVVCSVCRVRLVRGEPRVDCAACGRGAHRGCRPADAPCPGCPATNLSVAARTGPVRCPLCHDALEADPAACPGCEAAYHAECLAEAGCGTLGCGERRGAEPARRVAAPG